MSLLEQSGAGGSTTGATSFPGISRERWYKHAAVIGLLALSAAAASFVVAPGLRGSFGAALALLMIAIAVVDVRRFIIPNELTAGAFALALVHAATGEAGGVWSTISWAALRGAALALVFLALREAYVWLRGRQGLGLGDVKLAGVAGAWLSWSMIPIAVEIAALAGLAYYAFRQFYAGRPMRQTSRVPFGLFLAPAIWAGWFIEVLLDTL